MALIGTNGASYGIRGFLKAFDAVFGQLAYRTSTPSPEKKRHEGVWDREGRHHQRNMLRISRRKRPPALCASQRRRLLSDARRRAESAMIRRSHLKERTAWFVAGNPSPDRTATSGRRQSLYRLAGRDRTRHRHLQVPLSRYVAHERWISDAVTPADPDSGRQGQEAGNMVPGAASRLEDHLAHDTVHNRKDCSLIQPPSRRPMIPRGNM